LFWLGFGTKEMGSGVSLGVFEYACEGGFVSDRDWPGFVESTVCVLDKEAEVVGVLVLGDTDLSVSRELGDRGLVRLGDVELGELCAERYRLPDDGCVRRVGSDKLARALDVFSRANAAKLKIDGRLPFAELVERLD
jgi:hypothetical protein